MHIRRICRVHAAQEKHGRVDYRNGRRTDDGDFDAGVGTEMLVLLARATKIVRSQLKYAVVHFCFFVCGFVHNRMCGNLWFLWSWLVLFFMAGGL